MRGSTATTHTRLWPCSPSKQLVKFRRRAGDRSVNITSCAFSSSILLRPKGIIWAQMVEHASPRSRLPAVGTSPRRALSESSTPEAAHRWPSRRRHTVLSCFVLEEEVKSAIRSLISLWAPADGDGVTDGVVRFKNTGRRKLAAVPRTYSGERQAYSA